MARQREVTPLTDSQKQLVEGNVGLVFDLTKKYGPGLQSRCPIFDLDDLSSLGSLGLIDAALKYKPGLGVPFGAYAARRILGAMFDGVRKANGNYRKGNPTNVTFADISSNENGEKELINNIRDDSVETEYERVEDRLGERPRIEQLVAAMRTVSRRNLEVFRVVAPTEGGSERGAAVRECVEQFGISRKRVYQINAEVTEYIKQSIDSP